MCPWRRFKMAGFDEPARDWGARGVDWLGAGRVARGEETGAWAYVLRASLKTQSVPDN